MKKIEKVMQIKLPKGAEYRKVEVTKDGVNIFYEVVQRPVEGEWFEVNPKAINQTLFQKERKDVRQEATRKLIMEAFAEVKKDPKKYGKAFQTMMPEKTWDLKTVEEFKELAKSVGDHNADWVEQALEWAQRIDNGESWEAVCNEPDTANWYRLVKWKNGYYKLVGGSRKYGDNVPASYIDYGGDYSSFARVNWTVPLVVRYK